MKWLAVVFTALSCAYAQGAELPKSVRDHLEVERYIRACESEWAAVDVSNNTRQLAGCLADDYQGVSGQSG
jgi:hypothetical protein